jgi:uncharacterized membrane protein YfcA
MILLVIFAFLSSLWTTVVGVGGGILLISIMPGFLPLEAIVPVHGIVQFCGGIGRVAFGVEHIHWRIYRTFLLGAFFGVGIGYYFLSHISFALLPYLLGVFIITVTWFPISHRILPIRWRYPLLGLFQTALSLFVGAVGPLSAPFLLHDSTTKDQFVINQALFSITSHSLKLLVYWHAGFSFITYGALSLLMVGAVVAGAGVGTYLRGQFKDRKLKVFNKYIITLLAVRMILEAWR